MAHNDFSKLVNGNSDAKSLSGAELQKIADAKLVQETSPEVAAIKSLQAHVKGMVAASKDPLTLKARIDMGVLEQDPHKLASDPNALAALMNAVTAAKNTADAGRSDEGGGGVVGFALAVVQNIYNKLTCPRNEPVGFAHVDNSKSGNLPLFGNVPTKPTDNNLVKQTEKTVG